MENMNNLFDVLKERGYVYQSTNVEEVKKLCEDKTVPVYVGIDPTANSLHIGHFFALMMIKYFQDYGHKCIVLIGGATAQIGDPTGKSDMRKMLTKETIEENLNQIKGIVSRFVKTDGDNPAIIVNNADWLGKYSYIDFMREIGVHFNVNQMLTCDAYTTRMASGGLSFLEMGYMPMQAYDFVHLNKEYGCLLEIGGSDQWANIVAGVNLARKLALLDGKETRIQGLTCPLLTNSEGKKMGKTEKGTLWVAKDKTSVFDFYQYFYNTDDKDTEKLLKLFTRKPLDEIDALIKEDIRKAKQVMAYEITKLVHGEDLANEAISKANSLFKTEDYSNADEVKLTSEDLALSIADIILKAKLATSKGDARRMIEQNAYSLNGEKITDFMYRLTDKDFSEGYAILKKGKKNFIKLVK